jgi:glycosyltransferase involved in cell wall biosynthesis
MPSFTDRLAESTVLLADGATGTNYQDMGLEPGVAPEEWVVDAPDRVRELHRRFADAGSDLVLTCSFGATTPRLADGPLAGRAREVNIRAAELAREAVGDDLLVAGSLGPTGQLVEPYGLLTRELCAAAYAEQARALADGGVDLLVLETFFALFVGVLEPYKNIEGLTDAWRRGARQLPEAQLHLVGNGTRTDVAEALVRDHGARWDRELGPDGVAAALDGSWLLTLPSRAEGLGRVLVEAACRGRALVGAARGGIPDVVHHEENGLLVDPDDPQEIADALLRILGDRAYAEALGAAARRTGDEWSVTPAEYAAKVEAVVRSVLA